MEKEFEQYLEYLTNVKHYSEKTVSSYYFDLLGFSNYLKEYNLTFKDVKEDDIALYVNKLLIKGYKASSLNRKIVTLRGFYKYYAKEIERDFISPLINYNNLKQEKRLPKDLFFEQVSVLLTPNEKKRNYALRNQCLIAILLYTGIRVSECVNLDLLDLDIEECTIRVFGKGSKERRVFFLPSIKPIIKAYLEEARPHFLINDDEKAIFIGSKGGRITTRAVEEILNERAKQATNPFKVTPHMLRHTFATNLLNNNVDLKVVQELLGHESLSTTQIYTHVSRAHLKEVYEKSHPLAIQLEKIRKEKEENE